MSKFFKEIKNINMLDHPHVVKLLAFYCYKDDIFIVSEYYSGGEILDRINSLEKFGEKEAAHVMK